jgi:hypothetical protein
LICYKSLGFGCSGETIDYNCFYDIVSWEKNITYSPPKFRYLYEVGRRHPYFYAPELLYYAEKYKDILTECCQAADKDACLSPKVILKRRIRTSS